MNISCVILTYKMLVLYNLVVMEIAVIVVKLPTFEFIAGNTYSPTVRDPTKAAYATIVCA